MDFQIILLPRQDYWAWVHACRDYVLRFGPNMTPDPVTAANYRVPRQVITFPYVSGGYPEQGDIQSWLLAYHPGIRLDPIEAQSPEELREQLRLRVEEEDRYGQGRSAFKLLWPTNYPVITQRFGANPQIYHRWGLPGHEGLDLRALTNTPVYACADGTVYDVHTGARDHPYGIHVRIQHRDGYKTTYAHLARPLVGPGEVVEAGQPIGTADSTGNSSGAHLHLTLMLDGATERGETPYPKDIVDPTPFMVWPDTAAGKSLPVNGWPAGKCLIGVHGRIGGSLEESDMTAIAAARLEAVKLGLAESKDTIDRLRAITPGMFLAVRLSADFSGDPVPAGRFVSLVEADLGRLYRLGIRYFEVAASPNLQVEGWQRTWGNGAEFGGWFRQAVGQLHQAFPEARFGFPGLSPGGRVSGQRADATQFLHEAEEAVQEADWVGVNCYWSDPAGMDALDGGLLVEEYRLLFSGKLLFVTEFGNPSPGVAAQVKGRQYLEYYRSLRDRPGIGVAFAYALSARSGHAGIVWRGEGGGASEIPGIVGARVF